MNRKQSCQNGITLEITTQTRYEMEIKASQGKAAPSRHDLETRSKSHFNAMESPISIKRGKSNKSQPALPALSHLKAPQKLDQIIGWGVASLLKQPLLRTTKIRFLFFFFNEGSELKRQSFPELEKNFKRYSKFSIVLLKIRPDKLPFQL